MNISPSPVFHPTVQKYLPASVHPMPAEGSARLDFLPPTVISRCIRDGERKLTENRIGAPATGAQTQIIGSEPGDED